MTILKQEQVFEHALRVYAEDVDYGGVMYHANYLKFFERARTEWLRSLGYEQDSLAEKNILFIVTAVDVKYRQPARFNEKVLIKTRLEQRRHASLVLDQAMHHEKTGALLCAALVKVACVDKALHPCRLPELA